MKMDEFAYMGVESLAVVSLRIESSSVSRNHRFRMEPEPVERFVYIMNGSVCFSVENTEISASDRDMVYLPRNTQYQSRWLSDSDFVVVDLSLCGAEEKEISFGDSPSVLFHDEFCVYDGLLKLMAEKADEKDPFNWLERTSLCLKLLCDMARETQKTEADEKENRIKNAVTYLENNYAKDFSVEELAKMCYLSPSGFRRQFFECKGMSPVDFRNGLRIRRGAELLKSGKYSISRVAEMVGISDAKYFGKLFLRYMGTTPGAFRKKK